MNTRAIQNPSETLVAYDQLVARSLLFRSQHLLENYATFPAQVLPQYYPANTPLNTNSLTKTSPTQRKECIDQTRKA